MKCNNCGYNWNYTGNSPHPTCPNCVRKVFSVKSLEKEIKKGEQAFK